MSSVFFLTCPYQYFSEDFKYSRSLSSLCSFPLQYCFGEFSQLWPLTPSLKAGRTSTLPQNFLQAVSLGKHRTYLLTFHLSGLPLFSCLMFNIFRIVVDVQVFSCFTCEAKLSACYFTAIRGRYPLDEPLLIERLTLVSSQNFFFQHGKFSLLAFHFLAFQHMPFIYFSCLTVLLRPPVQNCKGVITLSVLVFYCL